MGIWGFFGKTRGEVHGEKENVACWSIKATISLKRVKLDEKMKSYYGRATGTHQRSLERYYPDPYGLPFSICCSFGLASQERVNLRTANVADTFAGSIRTKAHKFGRKGSDGVCRVGQFFSCPLLSQERVKLRTSNMAGIHSPGPSEQKPIKIL